MRRPIIRKSGAIIIVLLFVAAKCELPKVEEFADLTKDMSQSVRQTATQTIDFLSQGYAARSVTETKIEADIQKDLDAIMGIATGADKKENYPEVLRTNWGKIFGTLEQMVSYADALAAIKESGEKGEESFEKLANSLSGLASAAGFGTVSEPVKELGKFVYAKIAKIRASKKIEDVVVNADSVIQVIASSLDKSIVTMAEVNNIGLSENRINISNSKDNERIRNYFLSVAEKEKVNIEKLTLLNVYENGDRSALLAFVLRDPASLDKLGLPDLQKEIRKIQGDAKLAPKVKLDSIESIANRMFKAPIDAALNNQMIVNAIDIARRLKDIQQDLEFIRIEKAKYQPAYDAIVKSEKDFQAVAKVNAEFIEKSRKAIKAWAAQHNSMKGFFDKHQSLSFSNLKQHVEDIQELGTLIKNVNQK